MSERFQFSSVVPQAQFFAPRTVFPAPLRLIFLLAKRVYRSKKQGASGKKEVAKQKTKYIFLVRRLVKMAVQPEQKGAEEDDKMFLKERVRELKKENSEEKAEKIRLQEEVRRLQAMLKNPNKDTQYQREDTEEQS